MRGVFLHVLGDALGSVVVIISALVIKFVEADWKYKVDPAMRHVLFQLLFIVDQLSYLTHHLTHCSLHSASLFYLSIKEIYIVPLQGNYSEVQC